MKEGGRQKMHHGQQRKEEVGKGNVEQVKGTQKKKD